MTVSPAAARLRKLRKARGLSLRDLAAFANMNHGRIWAFEVGRASIRRAPYNQVEKLANALGVDVTYLARITEDD